MSVQRSGKIDRKKVKSQKVYLAVLLTFSERGSRKHVECYQEVKMRTEMPTRLKCRLECVLGDRKSTLGSSKKI